MSSRWAFRKSSSELYKIGNSSLLKQARNCSKLCKASPITNRSKSQAVRIRNCENALNFRRSSLRPTWHSSNLNLTTQLLRISYELAILSRVFLCLKVGRLWIRRSETYLRTILICEKAGAQVKLWVPLACLQATLFSNKRLIWAVWKTMGKNQLLNARRWEGFVKESWGTSASTQFWTTKSL